MRSLRGEDNEVVGVVVALIPVQVMDHFAQLQGPAEQCLHDLTVFVPAQQFGVGPAFTLAAQLIPPSDPYLQHTARPVHGVAQAVVLAHLAGIPGVEMGFAAEVDFTNPSFCLEVGLSAQAADDPDPLCPVCLLPR